MSIQRVITLLVFCGMSLTHLDTSHGTTLNGIVADAVPSQASATGSGFIIHPGGYILTAAHVIDEACSIEVTIGETHYPARVIKVDSEHDVALIKVDATGLPTTKLGNASVVTRQDNIWVFGYPFAQDIGLEVSTTSGHITAIQAKGRKRLIVIDAAVNPGNSGGPVVNSKGEVIGIVTSKFVALGQGFTISERLNFAVPISVASVLMAGIPHYNVLSIGTPARELAAKEVDRIVSRAVVLVSVQHIPPPLTVLRKSTRKSEPESPFFSRKPDNLSGPIEKVVEEHAKLTFQDGAWVEEPRQMDSVWIYSRDGKLLEEWHYDFNGHFNGKEIRFYDLNGKVARTQHYYRNTLVAGCYSDILDTSRCPMVSRITRYDVQGRKVEEQYLLSDGTVENSKVLNYDANGNVTEEIGYSSNGSVNWKFLHKYKCKREQVVETIHRVAANGLTTEYGSVIHRFEEDRKVAEENRTLLHYTKIYRYDASGNLIASDDTRYHENEVPSLTEMYDAVGHKVGFIVYDEGGFAKEKGVFKVGADGHRLEEVIYGNDSSVQNRTVYRYDKKGNLSSVIGSDTDGKSHQVMTLTYDAHGNDTEMISFAKDGSVESRASIGYEYDSHGNWIKAIAVWDSAKSGESRSVSYRTISYHKPRLKDSIRFAAECVPDAGKEPRQPTFSLGELDRRMQADPEFQQMTHDEKVAFAICVYTIAGYGR